MDVSDRRAGSRAGTASPEPRAGGHGAPLEVGVLGATGTVGRRLVRLLDAHPWFRLVEVAGSPSSAGRRLGEAAADDDEGPLPPAVAGLALQDPAAPWRASLLLSALPSAAARELERPLARRGHLVVSNASAHRMDPGVPLVIPEVNPDHLELLAPRLREGGALLTNPNCSVAGIATALAPLHRAFGLERVVVTTFQAISGAGRPGPSAGDLLDNVLPLIPGEEEKLERESRKILGRAVDGGIEAAEFRLGAHCTRVPVSHGHLASVAVAFRRTAGPGEVREALRAFAGAAEAIALPTAPDRPLEVLDASDRPQPRLDRDRGRGMTVTVGRIGPCPALDVRFFVLAHNLVRGAAGAALLNAELCHARGLTPGLVPKGGAAAS